MTTLRMPEPSDFSPEDYATLERVAKRMGQTPEDLLRPFIFGVQTHWPAWLEANFQQALDGYRRQGVLPPLAKEAMHVAVSMTNHCNTIAHGMRLEAHFGDMTAADVAPGGRFEHHLPGGRAAWSGRPARG